MRQGELTEAVARPNKEIEQTVGFAVRSSSPPRWTDGGIA